MNEWKSTYICRKKGQGVCDDVARNQPLYGSADTENDGNIDQKKAQIWGLCQAVQKVAMDSPFVTGDSFVLFCDNGK